jgi:hypothetical protein
MSADEGLALQRHDDNGSMESSQITGASREAKLRAAIKAAIIVLGENRGAELTRRTMSALEILGKVIGAEVREDPEAATTLRPWSTRLDSFAPWAPAEVIALTRQVLTATTDSRQLTIIPRIDGAVAVHWSETEANILVRPDLTFDILGRDSTRLDALGRVEVLVAESGVSLLRALEFLREQELDDCHRCVPGAVRRRAQADHGRSEAQQERKAR